MAKGLDDRVYDTDHTDLNSDFDESELRRELLEDVSYRFFLKMFPSLTRNLFFCSLNCLEMASTL